MTDTMQTTQQTANPATLGRTPEGPNNGECPPWFTEEEWELKLRQEAESAEQNARLAPLRQRTLLVQLKTCAWTGTKIDSSATRTVEETAGAEAGTAGKFHKQLIQADELRRIKRLQGRARQKVYRWTLPWADRGPRLVATAHLPNLIGEIRDLESELGAAVEAFLEQYPEHIEEARGQLGTLFQRHEYPSVAELRGAFRLDFHVFKHPPSEDLRLDLDDTDLDYLNHHRQRAQSDAVASATVDLLTRLAESLEILHSRLRDPDARLRKSLLGNVRHAARLVGDYAEWLGLDDLDSILEPIQLMTDAPIDTLRHNRGARQLASDEAQTLARQTAQILQKMAQ